jgi:hypothetical protein
MNSQFISLRPDETQDLTAIQGCTFAISARVAVSISTLLNESQSYDQFMSSTGLLVVTCVLLSYRGFHSCGSVAGSEQIYFSECTL